MTDVFIAFSFGVAVGAFIAGIAFGGAYSGFITRSWVSKRRGQW